MKYETIVESTPDGQLMLRLIIAPEDSSSKIEEQSVVIIPAMENDKDNCGYVTWQM